MNPHGPIVVIEDNADDQDLLEYVYKKTGYKNKLVFIDDPEEAIVYLNKKDVFPFLVLSDINMPKLSGFQLREMIFRSDYLRKKCIPYLFLTTGSNSHDILSAYELSVQGFFLKPMDIDEFEQVIIKILQYWKVAEPPASQ